MRESLRPGHDGDVLLMKANTVRRVKELTTPFQADILEPNFKADLVFYTVNTAEIIGMFQNLAQVFSPGVPDPLKCHIVNKGDEIAVVGKTSTATLQAVNFGAIPVRSLSSRFSVNLCPR